MANDQERAALAAAPQVPATTGPAATTGALLPEQPAESAPLTIPQVCDLVSDANLDWQKGWDGDPCEVNRFLKFARAIEAAHGIRAAGVKEPGNAKLTCPTGREEDHE